MERLTLIRGIHVRNVQVEETGTPFTILGDERLPVRDVFFDGITIQHVRGRSNRFKHVDGVHESNVRIREFADEQTGGA